MLTVGKKLKGKLVGRRIPTGETGVTTRGVIPAFPGAAGIIASYNTVQGIVRRALSGKFSSDPGERYGDGTYYLPTVEEIGLILKESELDRRTWMEDRFDCDDFAYVLKGEMSVHAYDTGDIRYGLCVGMVWGDFDWVAGYHAVNWFVARDSVLRFIEPQTDEIFDANHCQGGINLIVV